MTGALSAEQAVVAASEARQLREAWREQYADMFKRCASSAEAYAHIVIDQRLGRRRSLSYGYCVGSCADDARHRRTIRAQVDELLAHR